MHFLGYFELHEPSAICRKKGFMVELINRRNFRWQFANSGLKPLLLSCNSIFFVFFLLGTIWIIKNAPTLYCSQKADY